MEQKIEMKAKIYAGKTFNLYIDRNNMFNDNGEFDPTLEIIITKDKVSKQEVFDELLTGGMDNEQAMKIMKILEKSNK